MKRARGRGAAEEDGEIAGGSGEIVARAGGQIIPVIRGSPSRSLRSFSSYLSLARSLSRACARARLLLAPHPRVPKVSGPSDDADERVYIMARRFAPLKKEERIPLRISGGETEMATGG